MLGEFDGSVVPADVPPGVIFSCLRVACHPTRQSDLRRLHLTASVGTVNSMKIAGEFARLNEA